MKRVLGNAVTVFLVVGAAAVLLFEGARSTLLPDGAEAPAFDFEKHGGGRLTSAELQGQVVILDFWATYCPPCREEMPWLVEVGDELAAKGVRFVAVSHDDEEDRAAMIANFAKKVPGLEKYVVYGDPFTGGKYRVDALPTLYVIGKDGKVVASVRGSTSEWRVRRWVNEALEAR